MALYAGPLWRSGEPREGFVRIERGRVLEQGEGSPPGAAEAVILDGVHNFHTHVGDAFLQGHRLPHSLEALVKPGTGLKHRMLASARPATLVAAMRAALLRYAAAGTQSLLDFREQGLAGIRLARQAQRQAGDAAPRLFLLGRAANVESTHDLAAVAAAGDGLGLSSVPDAGDAAREYGREAQRAGKPLAIHVSEQRREPIEPVLSLRPQLLIHLVHATAGDLRRLREEDIPVVLCPTSNRFFRLRSPVAAVRRAGLRFHLGTDNAMLGSYDLLSEARLARRLDPRMPDEALLQALNTPPEKAIKRFQAVPGAPGGGARLMVLPMRRGRVQWQARPLLARGAP